ncbi:UNKNOWN [Stylonychia lemnae]|uniref:Uncharacterized protein n=1 Tax=Stylonychia lemnae TaxID=5949 RepID=A0A078AA33_STYLE|nr:UNKNOWN [Stylonychia lemnae]|eukprot:CDW79049.1 UNKNOWN [Stylonychia lemnae]
MEYPGYGLYHGNPESDQMLEDALHIYDHLVNELGVSESDLIVFGRSIGSSAATYLARHRNPCCLILMSPFKSIRDTARDLVGWLLSKAIADRFRNIDVIRDVKSPILIIHGQKDKLIPYNHSQDLHDAAINSQYCKLVLPPQMDHNDFNFDDDFVEPITEFFKQIGLRLNDVNETFRGIKFQDDYYFPPKSIVDYEKKIVKSSIIWDIIEDRKRQAEIRKTKSQKMYLNGDIDELNAINKLSVTQKMEKLHSKHEQIQNKFRIQNLPIKRRSDSKILLNRPQSPYYSASTILKGNQTIVNEYSDQPTNTINMRKINENNANKPIGIPSKELNEKMQEILNDGYKWDKLKTVGVRKTQDRISLKFN